MAYDHALPTTDTAALPDIRRIEVADIGDALARGVDDFWAMPTTHVIFLSLIYPVVGILLMRLTFGYDILPLLFPLAAGFALLGPFAAIWMYELSRRREEGLDVSWTHAFDVLYARSLGGIITLGLLLVAIFGTWLAVAQSIYVANFGYAPPQSINQFLHDIFATSAGWNMLIVGNLVGFLFALVALGVSVVSFPLLLDRHVSASTAILTSIRALAANPGPMALWGLIVAALLLIGSIPVFIGLAVVMPVLGHATWHLYRKVVEPRRVPAQQFRAPAQGHHYAAEFPASLFSSARDDDS